MIAKSAAEDPVPAPDDPVLTPLVPLLAGFGFVSLGVCREENHGNEKAESKKLSMKDEEETDCIALKRRRMPYVTRYSASITDISQIRKTGCVDGSKCLPGPEQIHPAIPRSCAFQPQVGGPAE